MLNQNELVSASQEQNYLPSIKEVFSFVGLFAAIITLFYFNNIPFFKYIAVLGLTALIFFSNKKLIWMAIFFVIIDRVGGFFNESTIEQALVGFPLITVMPGFSIGVKDLLLLALVFNLKTKHRFKELNADHIIIISLIVYATIVGGLLFGAHYKDIVTYVLRGYFIFALYFILREEFNISYLIKFFHLITLLLPFILLDQIYAAVTGNRLLDQFLGLNLMVIKNTLTLENRASPFGYNTVIFSFLYGLLLLSIRRKQHVKMASSTYGAFLLVASSFSILLSATRGSMMVFGVILLFSAPFLIVRFRNVAITLAVFFFMLNVLGTFGLNWDYFYRNSISRLMSTISPAFAGKELSEVASSGRDIELPILITHISESPVMGFGISSDTRAKYNNNFGGLNTFLQFGILGFLVVFFSLLRWFARVGYVVKRLARDSVYYSLGRITFASLMGMSLGYATTYNYFTSFDNWDVLRLTIIMFMSFLVFQYYRMQRAEADAEYLSRNSRKPVR